MKNRFLSLATVVILTLGFSGCVQNKEVLNTPKISIDNEIKPIQIKEVPLPYVKESKFIKILVLPFENAENDIDYGGYLEVKLESSRFIFNDNVKSKIIQEDTIGGI